MRYFILLIKPSSGHNSGMRETPVLFLLLVILTAALPCAQAAGGMQSHAEIHKVATEFVKALTKNMPGKVSYAIDEIDSRVAFPACTQLEAFLPTGAQTQGRTTIGIRCNDKNGWSLFIPANITITMDMLVSSHPLQQGQVIGQGDYLPQSGEVTQPGIITNETQILGKVVKYNIGAGQLLRQDMFRPPYAVTQGQTVQLVVEGNGIKLRTEGQALNNAADGQTTQVRVASGQIISGIARTNGIVEVQQ